MTSKCRPLPSEPCHAHPGQGVEVLFAKSSGQNDDKGRSVKNAVDFPSFDVDKKRRNFVERLSDVVDVLQILCLLIESTKFDGKF